MPTEKTPSFLTNVGVIENDRTTYFDTFSAIPILKDAADLNGTFDDAEVEATQAANLIWEVTGTGAAAPTRAPGGGIVVATGSSGGNETILGGHTGTGGNPYLSAIDWSTSDSIAFYAKIKMGSDVSNLTFLAGFKLTSVDIIETDNDQIFFRYEPSQSGGNFEVIGSNDGTDEVKDSGVSVTASTTYEMCIEVDSDRIARAYIATGGSWRHVATMSPMKADVDLLPFIGMETNASSVRSFTLRKIAVGKKDND